MDKKKYFLLFLWINIFFPVTVQAEIDCQFDPSGLASHAWVLKCTKEIEHNCPYKRGASYPELGGRVFIINSQCRGWVYADTDASDGGVDCLSHAKKDGGHCYQWSINENITYAGFKMITATDKNTAILEKQEPELVNYPAAKACKEFTHSGLTNWRLPDADLLNNLYQLAYSFPHDDSFTYKGQTPYYWSSSEYSASNSWEQNFDNGEQFNVNKSSYYRVRCVRAFS